MSHTTKWAGPTFSLYHLVRGLRDRIGITVVMAGHGPFTEALRAEGVETVSVRTLGKRGIPALYRLIVARDYDLVYGNNTSGACRNALLASKLARRPFICHVRGMGRRGQWRGLGFLRFADAVVAVSGACARSVERYAGRDRVHVVHNGVELSTLEAEARGPREPGPDVPGLPAHAGPIVLSVSQVRPRKGQHHAVEAMAGVARQLPSARLLLAGALDRDPAYVETLRRRIETLGLRENVTVLGFRRDVPRLFEAADVFLHTAVADPHPRSVIEAMAAGLPVVAFEVDGVAETVKSGSTGFLFPIGEVDALAGAIVRLLRDPALRRDQGGRGRQRVFERFTAEATARGVERIIGLTLEGRMRGSEAGSGVEPAARAPAARVDL